MKTYLVGGAVRDQLLHLPVHERDWVVVGATVDQLLELGYQQVGREFPVFLHPQTHDEYALARTERKTNPGYTGFVVHADPDVTLEEDLKRRDLTINAIAQDEHGQIIDPFNGQADLEQGILRHISPAFCEDPVRILRIARFAARFSKWGFRVADETNDLMKQMVVNGEVDALVPERVWAETEKALQMEQPWRFFEVLRECGALKVIYPEINALWGVPQPPQHHPEVDTGVHTMMVLEQATLLSDNTQVRFAALTHDLGKGETPADVLPGHKGHEQRSAKLVKQLCRRQKVPNDFRDLARLVAEYHTHCHRALELRSGTLLDTLVALDALRRPQRFEHFLLACEADARGRTGFEQCPFPQADFMRKVQRACAQIDTTELQQQGLEGMAFADALRTRRLEQITRIKNNNTQVSEE